MDKAKTNMMAMLWCSRRSRSPAVAVAVTMLVLLQCKEDARARCLAFAPSLLLAHMVAFCASSVLIGC